MSLNQVALMGKISNDPSMKYSTNGLAITEFVLETTGSPNRPNDKHKIVCFGKGEGDDGVAGFVAQNMGKGTLVIVVGRLSGQEFTTKENKTFLNSQVNAFSVEKIGE